MLTSKVFPGIFYTSKVVGMLYKHLLSAPVDILAATLLFAILVIRISRNTSPISIAVDTVSVYPFLVVSISSCCARYS